MTLNHIVRIPKKIIMGGVKMFTIFLPWKLKRIVLQHVFGYKISPSAHIGFAYVYPKHLRMESGAVIKHLNVVINLDDVIMEENALIDRSNWITGYPTGTDSDFFKSEQDRKSQLVLGANSVITKNHHFDCTNQITIGKFVTIAGYSSQFLTHSVNLYTNSQGSRQITIGDYCFISTRVIILGGTSLPQKSVLAAGAVLNKSFCDDEPYGLYAGVPAKRQKDIDKTAKYFYRTNRDVI